MIETPERKAILEPDEWLLLPGGWVIRPSFPDSREHLLPAIPGFGVSATEVCWNEAPMRILGLASYNCSRQKWHGGRHLAALPDGRGVRRVVAVWADGWSDIQTGRKIL